MNCTTRAHTFLEAIQPGAYAALIRHTLEQGGIIHAAPDCFCLAVPDSTDPHTLLILFQCSQLPALWRLAHMYRHQYRTIRYRRDFKNGYPARTVPLSRLLRKTTLVNLIDQKHSPFQSGDQPDSHSKKSA